MSARIVRFFGDLVSDAVAFLVCCAEAAWAANAGIFRCPSESRRRAAAVSGPSSPVRRVACTWSRQDDEKRSVCSPRSRRSSKPTSAASPRMCSARSSSLKLAVIGANPYEGFRVTEPTDAVRLEIEEGLRSQYEGKGLEQAASTAFVIVAGGLGERLGYKGIKLALPERHLHGDNLPRAVRAMDPGASVARENRDQERQAGAAIRDHDLG